MSTTALIHRFSLALAALALAGCSSLNPFASSAPEPAKLQALDGQSSLRALWRASVSAADERGGFFTPAVVGDSVYSAGSAGDVVKITDGKIAWRVDVDSKLIAGTGSDGELVVVVAKNGDIIALAADNGSERWRAPAGLEVLSAPLVVGGQVIVRASDNRLVAFAHDSGEQSWLYQRKTPALAVRVPSGLVAVAEQGLIAGYPGGKLVAIDLDNGARQWELGLSAPRGVTELERISDIVGTPVLAGKNLCAVAYQGKIGCFDLSDGNLQWAQDFSSSTGLDRDVLFVVATSQDDGVHAFDVFGGELRWRQTGLKNRLLSAPLLVGGDVLVGDLEGYVHALARADGSLSARAQTNGSPIDVAPVRLDSDSFVVQTRSGGLFAFAVERSGQ